VSAAGEGRLALDAVLAVLGWIGTGLAALLAAALLARRGDAGERWLGLGMAVAAAAGALVTASHAGVRASWLEGAEVAVTLLAGPLVAAWFAGVVGWKPPRPGIAVAVAPALLWAGFTAAGAGFTADREAIRWAVVVQMAWSAAVAIGVGSRWPRLGAASRRAVAAGLTMLSVLHLAQLVRLAAPTSSPRNLVPASLGLVLVALTWSALRQTRLSFGSGASGGLSDDESRALVAELDRWLVGERAFAERGMTVAAAADRLAVSPARLSRALNRGVGHSFSDHLAALRVTEAERLLADPAHAHLSVEAIGGRAGFGSRSTFYAEFRRRTGRTPAEWRESGGTATF
jgi:AraC-like DNA-binding protein